MNTPIVPETPQKDEPLPELDDLHEPFNPDTDVWMLSPDGLCVAMLGRYVIILERIGWTRMESGVR